MATTVPPSRCTVVDQPAGAEWYSGAGQRYTEPSVTPKSPPTRPLNAFVVFLAIAAVGFLFLMISLFFGEIFEHFDSSLDHDLEHGGPGFFSTRIISVFITAFGGFGAIATDQGASALAASMIGAVAGYLALWLVYWAFKLVTGKEGMGYGDFKLLAAIGAWLGWQKLPLVILLSSVVGAAVGIALIVLARHAREKPIPFGPYLAAAGLIALFWGDHITRRWLPILG